MSNTISTVVVTFERLVAAISVLILASAAFARNGQSIIVSNYAIRPNGHRVYIRYEIRSYRILPNVSDNETRSAGQAKRNCVARQNSWSLLPRFCAY